MRNVLWRLLVVCGIAVGAVAVPAVGSAPAQAWEDCNCSRSEAKPVQRKVFRQAKPVHHRVVRSDGIHDGSWMQKQGFTYCSQVKDSCERGAGKSGHGLAYAGVCYSRLRYCMRTGCWSTTNTGSICGLARY